jgi:hypothetical protein
LDKYYPKECRESISEIYLNEPDLEGELNLEGFTYTDWRNGIKIYISHTIKAGKLKIKNPPKGSKIIKCVNAQK